MNAGTPIMLLFSRFLKSLSCVPEAMSELRHCPLINAYMSDGKIVLDF
jgi:hypothetical protein